MSDDWVEESWDDEPVAVQTNIKNLSLSDTSDNWRSSDNDRRGRSGFQQRGRSHEQRSNFRGGTQGQRSYSHYNQQSYDDNRQGNSYKRSNFRGRPQRSNFRSDHKNYSESYENQQSYNNDGQHNNHERSYFRGGRSNFRTEHKSHSDSYEKSSFHQRGRSQQRGSYFRSDNRNRFQSYQKEDDKNSDCLTADGLIDWAKIKNCAEEYEKERFGDLAKVEKVTYKETPKIAALSPEEVKAFRKFKNEISISTVDRSELPKLFNPVQTFEDAFQEYPNIMKLIHKQGFKEPSPIQCQLWPILMSGYDSIGIAQTGTGKTLAYLLPGLLHIAMQPNYVSNDRAGPLMLILGPTRELVQQIHQEVSKFNYKNMKSVCVYGQGDRREQLRALENKVEIIAATPGRLIDFVNNGDVDLKEVSYLVLDEADRMLDLGFQPDIIRITSSIRRDRQTVLTSATWLFDVEYIAKKLTTNPIKVQVGQLDLAAVGTVTQIVEVCEEDEKFDKLIELLDDLSPVDKIIIFTNRKATADYLSTTLFEKGVEARVMHGGLEQCDREEALYALKTGEVQILCATDVASRGLDICDLTKVINFDLPKNLEEYVHRSGRTGRAGKSGIVISFVTWDNKTNVEELIKILERSNQSVPNELSRMAERAHRWKENRDQARGRGGGGRGRRGRF